MLPMGQISRPSVAVDRFHLDWELQGVGWRGDAFLALNLHPEYWALYWVLKETSATRIHLGHFHRWHSGSVSKESACSAGDLGSIPRSGGSHGEGNGNPLQYFCLGNPMGRGAWWATVHGVARVRHGLTTKLPPPTPCVSEKMTYMKWAGLNKFLPKKGRQISSFL